MRLLFNWALKSALLVLFSTIGWIALKTDGQVVTSFSWTAFFTAALLALAMLVIGMFTVLVTFGCTAILGWLTLGPIALWLASVLFPSLVGLTGFWQTVAAGFLVMFIGIPSPRED